MNGFVKGNKLWFYPEMVLQLPDISAATKLLPQFPEWKQRDKDWLFLVSPLDIDGVTVEGLQMRATALVALPDECVTFQIEYYPRPSNVKGGPLCRIEWRPLKGHNNKNRGPVELRNVPQKCSHDHGFDLNWGEDPKAVRRGELPLAVPINQNPQDFEGLLAFVKKEFRISNVELIERPPWREAFL